MKKTGKLQRLCAVLLAAVVGTMSIQLSISAAGSPLKKDYTELLNEYKGTNLAFGATGTSQDTYDGAWAEYYGPDKMFDGDLGTRWATSGERETAEILISLPKASSFNYVEIQEDSGYIRTDDAELDYKAEDGSWKSIFADAAFSQSGRFEFRLNESVTASELRLRLTDVENQGPTIAEFGLYALTGAPEISCLTEKIEVDAGQTAQIEIVDTVEQVNFNPAVEFTSKSNTIAQVNGNGVVTGISAGETNIEAEASVLGEKTVFTIPVTVNKAPQKPLLKYYGITQNSVSLYWTETFTAESYDIYQADAALGLTIEDMTKINAEPVTECEYLATGLNAGSEYRFVVVANLADKRKLSSNQANVPTAKQMNGTSLESGENANLKMPYSSLALNMEYKGPTLSDEGWFNWCVSPIKAEGEYHIFTSRWPEQMGNWTVKGQIIHSVADNPEGPYHFKEVILCDPALIDTVDEAQRDTVLSDLPGHAPHNCRIKKVGDQYALTFIMQTDSQSGVGGQKIALLVSDSVNGPWRWAGGEKGFVVEPSTDPEHWTYNSVVGTDNHDIIKIGDEYRIYFKAGPQQNASMHYGYAYSDNLEGPYTLCDEPALSENKNYIEDATVFEWNDTVYLLSTDNHGANTGVLGYGILWKSNDQGKTFKYKDAKIGYGLIKDYIKWPVTGANDVYNGQTGKFERPAILMGEDGNPEYFFGTLGMNLDGNKTAQSFMLKINWQPGSQKNLMSIGEVSLKELSSEGTMEQPATATISLAMDELSLDNIVGGGMTTELFSDASFSETFENNTVPLKVEQATHLYIKITAEDKSTAYYDIAVTGEAVALPWDGTIVTDENNYGAGYGPEKTIDGNLTTRWAARRPTEDYKGDFSLTYELGTETSFNRIKMYEINHPTDGNRIKSVQVQTSVEGQEWKTVQVFDGLKNNDLDTEVLDLDSRISTKYLKLIFSTDLRPEEQNKQAEPNILELELYDIHRQPSESADKTILNQVIAKADELLMTDEFSNAISSVQKSFKAALETAQKLANDDYATQEQVDAAWVSLMTEIHKLGLQQGDKAALREHVELYSQLNLDLYLDGDAKDNFVETLDAAKAMLSNTDAVQSEVDAIDEALVLAVQTLTKRGDKTTLQTVVDQTVGYVESNYAKGWTEFAAALEAAQIVLDTPNVTQEELSAATDTLIKAMLNLRLKADKNLLNAVIASAESLDVSGYSEASVKLFNESLAKAKATAVNESLSTDEQNQVIEAVDGLSAAIAQLSYQDGTPANLIVNGDGSVTGGNRSAKTGENTPIGLAMTTLLLACGALFIKRRKL